MSGGGALSFRVILRNQRVQKELDALPGPDHGRVLAVLRMLAEQPHPSGCVKLYGSVYRVRVGDWRIIYLVDEEHLQVIVGGIRRRNERTYKRIEDLFG